MNSLRLDDLDALTEECFSFVSDPHPSRSARVAIEQLSDIAPHVVDVLEAMVLDGVDDRRDVADYIQHVFGT
jgi:hypothetical protein